MIYVIADDLTGAAEVAGICIRYGVEVVFGIDTIPEKKATVTIIATDSRSMTAKEAYTAHLHIAKQIVADQKNAILFKKCDSALRGHIINELSALVTATQKNQILLQPSNPISKRFIKKGQYWIEDQLLENTGFSNDPDFPATTSMVTKLITKEVPNNINKLKIFCGNSIPSEWEGIVIPDCLSIEDLKKSAQMFHSNLIVSGSSAFFEQFLITQGIVNSEVTLNKLSPVSQYLLISGSTHPESIDFAAKSEQKGSQMMVFPDALLGAELDEIKLKEWALELSKRYNETQKLTLRTSNSLIQFPNSSKILKHRMSLVVHELLTKSNINELYIEGGATAYAILEQMNWKKFTPIAELAPGVVRMQLTNNKTKHITIKPGSYKWPEGLLQ